MSALSSETGPSESHWLSLSAAALTAVVVGFASTILVVMQAADAVGATDAQKISWAAMLCFGMGLLSLVLCWRHRMPIIIAWSTPGAALLATGAHGTQYAAALGAFAMAGVLTVITGLVKPVARAIEQIPAALASAMLAGVLVSYVLKVPAAAVGTPALVVPLIVCYFGMRFWKPLYAVPVIVVLGLVLAVASGTMPLSDQHIALSRLTFDIPQFSWAALVSICFPLYLVTMASQNLPGFAVMRAHGYPPPVASCLIGCGVSSVIGAPMGGPQINMAAITAALAMGPDAHPDPAQRWKVCFPYLVIYGVLGLAAGTCVSVLGAMPHDLVIAIAGLALLSPLMGGLTAMVQQPKEIEAAVVTFLVTASGFSLFGVGAAFWGLLAGLVLWGIKHLKERA